jgi:hypothetical protein
MSSPKIKNISLYPKGNQRYDSARLTRQEGRIAIVTNVRWDAVDAEVPITNGADAYGKDVWS